MSNVDYDAIQQALVDLLANDATLISLRLKKVWYEGSEEEAGAFHNMPCLNVRLVSSEEEGVSIPKSTNEDITFKIDVIVFDFTSFRAAAKLRASLLAAAKTVIRDNFRPVSTVNQIQLLGTTDFGSAGIEGAKGFLATASFTVVCGAYND